MKLFLPFVLNEANEPVGLFTIYTSQGPVVVIFSSFSRWELVASWAQADLEAKGQYVGAGPFDAASVEEVAAQIIAGDPTLSKHTFISDTDPLFEEIFELIIQAIE